MTWQAKTPSLIPMSYEIKYDPAAGFYFYVFKNNLCIKDYLQDTLDIAIEMAWEDFGVPKNVWKKVKD